MGKLLAVILTIRDSCLCLCASTCVIGEHPAHSRDAVLLDPAQRCDEI